MFLMFFILTMDFATLLNLLTRFGSYQVGSLEFSMYKITLSTREQSFILSFFTSSLTISFFLSYRIDQDFHYSVE